jgi:spermidine synthase
MSADTILFETSTPYGHYQVIDTVYEGRPARVLFSGDHVAAQSGVPLDDSQRMLFDYNQRLFELVEQRQPDSLLMIGGGAFTLPSVLAHVLPQLDITVVELDSALTPLAEKYFELVQTDRLHVVTGEGRAYLEATTKHYDVIIIDAFSHVQMPGLLITKQAAAAMANALTPNGVLAINTIAAYRGRRMTPLVRLIAALQDNFKQISLYPANNAYSMWTAQNFILVGQQQGDTPTLLLNPVAVLETDADDALDDAQIEAA